MKRAVTGTVCALAVVVIGWSAQTSARSEGAIVIRDGMCGLLDGDGNFAIGEVHSVQTAGGVTNYLCKAKKVNNAHQVSVDYNYGNTGMACMTKSGATVDWTENVSASGNATLMCHARN